jgi:hypothetical protein
MSETPYNPHADRATGLAYTASGLAAVTDHVHTLAKLLLEGIDSLRGDLAGEAPTLTDDGREPGFFRVPLGAGAAMDPAERGNLHIRMAAALSGVPELDTLELGRTGEQHIAEIIADLWSVAGRHDMNVGRIIEASFEAMRRRLDDGQV